MQLYFAVFSRAHAYVNKREVHSASRHNSQNCSFEKNHNLLNIDRQDSRAIAFCIIVQGNQQKPARLKEHSPGGV